MYSTRVIGLWGLNNLQNFVATINLELSLGDNQIQPITWDSWCRRVDNVGMGVKWLKRLVDTSIMISG